MMRSDLAKHLQQFFTDRLLGQTGASPHTVASYRDTFRLLLKFASKRLKCQVSSMSIIDLDAKLVSAFLQHLEKDRQNSPRSRNSRLCAIRSFFTHVTLNDPALANHCQRIIGIPLKKHVQSTVEYLTSEESIALIMAPNTKTWLGRRDQIMLKMALQTGLRNSELIRLRQQDIQLGSGAHVRCLGKGRKNRCTPLTSDMALCLQKWLEEQERNPTAPLFPTAKGSFMSSDALQRLVARHVQAAAKKCASLRTKRISPHTLRHTTAMDLLHRGVDITVIALWLGHESIQSTQSYLHADMEIKEKALATVADPRIKQGRYRASDQLLEFLESL